ncbi:uncharacterized protein METZ01_LOCUS355972, partial [marine metagenome]
MDNIEIIKYKNNILAIIIKKNTVDEMKDLKKSICFPTPDEFPFQIGLHRWEAGKI